MKSCFAAFLILFALITDGCSPSKSPCPESASKSPVESPSTIYFLPESSVDPVDCMLCNVDDLYFCNPSNPTVMILCLNTWRVGNTYMYEYDDVGNLVEYSGATRISLDCEDPKYCKWIFESNTGNHTCDIYIQYGESSSLKPDNLVKQLCPHCLSSVYNTVFSGIYNDSMFYSCDVLLDTFSNNIYSISSKDDEYCITQHDVHIHTDINYYLVEIAYAPSP